MQAVLALVARRIVFAIVVMLLSSGIIFAGTAILPGDALEVSIPPQEPVWDMIVRPMINTLLMAAVGILIVPGAAFALGIWSALRPGGRLDAVLSSVALLGYSMPEFVLGNVLILIFAVILPWQLAVITLPTDSPPMALLAVLALPIVTLFLTSIAYQFRLVRAAMIDVLRSDFVERARLAGLPEWRVVLRHALPVAAVPALAGTAQFMAALLSGLLVIEIVFNYPGLGVRVVEAIGTRDVFVIQAIGFLAALAVLVSNLLADIAIIVFDPRATGAENG
jgi:peptide/nickel transport system permease protein